MPEKRRGRFRIRLDVLALLVAAASLLWQVFDAVQKQREHISAEVVFVRQPVPGKIDINFTVHNPGSRSLFVESFETRAYVEKKASAWQTVPWTSAPAKNVIEPGQSLTATLTAKSLEELREFLQQTNPICFYFQSQGGSSVHLWMEPDLKQRVYTALAFQQPNKVLHFRAL
jgi:hypothetical protein